LPEAPPLGYQFLSWLSKFGIIAGITITWTAVASIGVWTDTNTAVLDIGIILTTLSYLCSMRLTYGKVCLIPPELSRDLRQNKVTGVRFLAAGVIIFNIIGIVLIVIIPVWRLHQDNDLISILCVGAFILADLMLLWMYNQMKRSSPEDGVTFTDSRMSRRIFFVSCSAVLLLIGITLLDIFFRHNQSVLSYVPAILFLIILGILSVYQYYSGKYGSQLATSPQELARYLAMDCRSVVTHCWVFILIFIAYNVVMLVALYVIDHGIITLKLEKFTGFLFWMGWITMDAIILCAAYAYIARSRNPENSPSRATQDTP
jgi:hypothetical protein